MTAIVSPVGLVIPPSQQIWSSQRWITYFEHNRDRLMAIPWDEGVSFSLAEATAIADSLREFQLGESGEGRHFKKVAARWAERTGDLAYLPALQLFIQEEQRHARDLGRVLDLAGLPRATVSPTNSIFRHLRHLAGLELSIVVLVTAEIVAQIYYRCLLNATSSPVLKTLCRQILRDEVQHVRFQCQRLAIIRTTRWRWVNTLWVAAQWCLLVLTSLIIWRKHGPAIRRGGLGYFAFLRGLLGKMTLATRLMRPSAI